MPNSIPYIGADQGADVLRLALQNRTFDPVALARLRREREQELQDQLANDESAALVPMEGYEPGRPGVRTVSNVSAASNAQRTRRLLSTTRRDIADDAYTGTDEQDRIGAIQDVLDRAAMTNRPEVADAAKTTAQRNAFAKFLDAEAPYKAQASDAGRAALDAASRRKVEENQANWLSKDAAKGLSAEGTKELKGLTQAVDLGQKLKIILDKRMAANPGETNPDNVRERGFMGQLADVAGAKAKRWAYGEGFLQPPEGYDEATQLADWMKVQASKGVMGAVRNMEWIKQIQDHLTAGRLPDAANMQRLNVFLETAPDLARDIVAVEKGHDYSLGGTWPGGRPGAGRGEPAPAAAPTAGAYDQYLRRRGGS